MIFGIGVDVVEVARIEDSLARFGNAFAERILNEAELKAYSLSNTPARFLAKRFAVKEAFAKALGTGLRGHVTFQNISVKHDSLGKPELVIASNLQAFLDERGICHMHLSVSDEKNIAAAFVVLEI